MGCSVVGSATSFEDDYKSELTAKEDPTLLSTNLDQNVTRPTCFDYKFCPYISPTKKYYSRLSTDYRIPPINSRLLCVRCAELHCYGIGPVGRGVRTN